MRNVRTAATRSNAVRTPSLGNLPRHCLLGLTAAVFMLSALSAAAAKPPQMIRDHLLNDPDRSVASVGSVEPFRSEPLDALLTEVVWKVEYSGEDQPGESLVFMAVHDGEVLRILDFDSRGDRANLLTLLADDFRVRSEADAKQLVNATLELYFGFPFSEPEKTVDEMRIEERDGEYFFVDGERFGDATGYRISTDAEGRVTAYEYSWELPVEPLEE